MNYTPLADKVIVERIAAEKTTSSGIVLQRSDEVDRAEVISIGPDVDEVQVGDIVLLNWNAAIKFKMNCIQPKQKTQYSFTENKMSDGGKGSSPRPYSVDKQTFDNNWNKIFGKKTPQEVDDAKAEDEAFEYIKKLADSK